MILERPGLSDREIARIVGVSNSTVSSPRRALCDPHTGGDERPEAARSENLRAGGGSEPLGWEVTARRLAEDVDELLSSCRKLLGGADFKAAGRQLYHALADLYGEIDALTVIEELTAVVSSADAFARKAMR